MRVTCRPAAALAALLVLANCATTPSATETTPAKSAPAGSRANDAAVACLAEAVYFEARGTGDVGTQAVAHVVVNRARDPEFPSSVCGVVGEGCQFSYRCDGRPDALAHAADRAHALRTAQQVLAGAPDITEGALFFHSARVSPSWFRTRPRIGTYGGNVFYR